MTRDLSPKEVVEHLAAQLPLMPRATRSVVEAAIQLIRERYIGTTIEPGAITVNLGDRKPTPADVAQVLDDIRFHTAPGPVPTRPRPKPDPVSGTVTARDRFLDQASDRRCALSAAARYMADGRDPEPDVLTDLSDRLYLHLREGKSDA